MLNTQKNRPPDTSVGWYGCSCGHQRDHAAIANMISATTKNRICTDIAHLKKNGRPPLPKRAALTENQVYEPLPLLATVDRPSICVPPMTVTTFISLSMV